MRTVSTVPDREERLADGRRDFEPGPASLAAAVVLVLSATTVVLATVDSRPGEDYQRHTLLLASDVALLSLAVVSSGSMAAAVRAWRRHACALGGLVVGLAMVPGLVVNPSDRGLAALLRWGGAMALALSLGSPKGDGRRLVVGGLAVVTLTHVAVAMAERFAGGPVGLTSLGEPSAYEIGGRYASTGLTVHPYVLAAWCVVAGTALIGLQRSSTRRLARIAGGVGVAAFTGIGLTMSRAGILAGALALIALTVSARRPATRAWRLTLLAAAAAMALGLLLNLSGWAARAGQSTSSVDAVTSGRSVLVDQATGLLGDDLVTGVGPGRYVLALIERPDLVALSDQTPRPVHITPLLLVVEGGLVVVPALALLALAIAAACRRGGAPAVAVTLAMLPFLALDHLAWSYPQGIVLTGVWLGVLDLFAARAADEQKAAPDPAARTGLAT